MRRFFIAVCVSAMLSMLSAEAQKMPSIEECTEYIKDTYDVTLNIVPKYSVTQTPEFMGWTQSCPKKGHFFFEVSMVIENKKKTVAVLMPAVHASSPDITSRAISAGKSLLDREINLITGCDNVTIETHCKALSDTESLVWADIPAGLTLFSRQFPLNPNISEEDNPTFIQQLYTTQYPVLRRYFYIKEGVQPFPFIVLSKGEGEKTERQIQKMLALLLSKASISGEVE